MKINWNKLEPGMRIKAMGEILEFSHFSEKTKGPRFRHISGPNIFIISSDNFIGFSISGNHKFNLIDK